MAFNNNSFSWSVSPVYMVGKGKSIYSLLPNIQSRFLDKNNYITVSLHLKNRIFY